MLHHLAQNAPVPVLNNHHLLCVGVAAEGQVDYNLLVGELVPLFILDDAIQRHHIAIGLTADERYPSTVSTGGGAASSPAVIRRGSATDRMSCRISPINASGAGGWRDHWGWDPWQVIHSTVGPAEPKPTNRV